MLNFLRFGRSLVRPLRPTMRRYVAEVPASDSFGHTYHRRRLRRLLKVLENRRRSTKTSFIVPFAAGILVNDIEPISTPPPFNPGSVYSFMNESTRRWRYVSESVIFRRRRFKLLSLSLSVCQQRAVVRGNSGSAAPAGVKDLRQFDP